MFDNPREELKRLQEELLAAEEPAEEPEEEFPDPELWEEDDRQPLSRSYTDAAPEDWLEELGLVERAVSDRCRREKLVSPTPEGLVLAGAIQQSVDEWNAVCFQGFSPQERALFTDLFTRITQNAMEYKQGEKEHG